MFSGTLYCKRKPYGSRAALPGLDKDWLTPLEPLAKVIPSWKMEDGISRCVFPALPHSDQIFFTDCIWAVNLLNLGSDLLQLLTILPPTWLNQAEEPPAWVKHRELQPEQVKWTARADATHALHGHYRIQGRWKRCAPCEGAGRDPACSAWVRNRVPLRHRKQLKWVTAQGAQVAARRAWMARAHRGWRFASAALGSCQPVNPAPIQS